MKKLIAGILALLCLTGCGVVGDIAGNVANAAVEELEKQIKETAQSYKLEVLDVKATVGNLNSETESAKQLFCAVLVAAESEASLQACVKALDAVFEQAGYEVQTGREISHPHLVNKQLQYREFTEEPGKTYYTLYGYSSDVSLKLPDLSGMIQGEQAPADNS